MNAGLRSLSVTLALAVLVLGTPGRPVRAAEAALPQQIELRLMAAAFVGEEQPVDGPTLILNLTKTDGRWERIVGTAGNLSRGIHIGYVNEAQVSDRTMLFDIEVNVVGDGYTKLEARGEYRAELKPTKDGRFKGTYSGTFKGIAVKGRAEATLLPPLAAPKIGFLPIAPGEHPRLLFRHSDLPALKAKAKTPLGKVALAKMDDGIGLGVRYQLTGDKKLADEARAFVEHLLEGNYSQVKAPGSHHGMLHYGPVWEQAAVTYDLCHDAWSAEFRGRVQRFLVLWTNRILFQHMMFNTQAQYDLGNSEAGWFHYGPALGGLAMWGEKGPPPVKPVAPDAIEEIPPDEGYKPGKGVPVVVLEPGKSPNEWLTTAPVNAIIEGDPLAELGGAEKCRPAPFDSFRFGGRKYEFGSLKPEFVPEGGGVILNIGKSLQQGHIKTLPGPEMIKDGPLTLCLYTVLDNKEPRLVKVFAPYSLWGRQQFVLAGHNLAHEQVVKLQKGLYPLLIVLRVNARWNHLLTKLEAATPEDAQKSKTLLTQLKTTYEGQLRDYEWDLAEWKRTGGVDQGVQKLFEVTRWAMYTHFREGFGSGAAQSDTSGMCHSLGLLPATYAAAYRRAFGVDLSPYPDITHFVARRMFAHIYPATGEPISQEVNGPNNLGPEYFAVHFPIVPEAWKPAVLWGWQRFLGIRDGDDVAKVLAGPIASVPIRAFLDYPLDMQPQPPKGILPLAWEAPDFGYYGFRNAWDGKDDFLVQVYGRFQSGHGYSVPNAGNFTIAGLGHNWAVSLPSLRLHNQRTFANVVLLKDDETNDDARGRLLYAKTEKDGSGVVSFDLGDVYGGAQSGAKGKPLPLYERYGNVRRASAFKPTGIEGLRAIAVDYSGRSGAPCLFVLVDQITGGRNKVWCWRIQDDEINEKTKQVIVPGDLKNTQVEGNTVTVAAPDGATMRLTFVAPTKADVKAENREIVYTKTYNRGKGERSAPGIYASGADPTDGQFFAVATIHRGAPPPVKIEGKGLTAKVRVGGQTVSFDGQKIVLGK